MANSERSRSGGVGVRFASGGVLERAEVLDRVGG